MRKLPAAVLIALAVALPAAGADRILEAPKLDLNVDRTSERGGRWGSNRQVPPPPTAPPDPAPPVKPVLAPQPAQPLAERQDDLTLADARENFPGLAESFIADNSPNGYWPLRDEEGVVVKFKLQKLLPSTVAREAPGHFSGIALLRDVAGGAPRRAELSLDLSSDHWTVDGVRLLPAEASPPSKKAAPRSSHARPKP